MPAMYCITHKIIRLSQVICANGSRKLFRFRVRYFFGLKYYFTWKITSFRNLFSVCPGFRYIGGSLLGRFYCILPKTVHNLRYTWYSATQNSGTCLHSAPRVFNQIFIKIKKQKTIRPVLTVLSVTVKFVVCLEFQSHNGRQTVTMVIKTGRLHC